MPFKVIDYINRKKAGMYALCCIFANDLENKSKQNANWKDRTAHARQSLHSGVKGSNNNYSIYVSHGVDYGEILEEGSKPHIIKPKNKKALYWKGAAHPVREVHHPGTKGFKTLEKTINSNTERIKKNIVDYWSD